MCSVVGNLITRRRTSCLIVGCLCAGSLARWRAMLRRKNERYRGRSLLPPTPAVTPRTPPASEAAQPPLGPLLRSIARSACLTVLVTLPSPSRVWTPLPGENIIVVLEKPFAPLAGASNLWHHLPTPRASNTPLLKPPHGGRFQPRTTEGFMTRRRSTGKELLQLPVLGDLGFP